MSSTTIPAETKTYFFTGKINGAVNQDNQFQISAFGNPTNGTLLNSTQSPQPGVDNETLHTKQGAWDLSGKWTSKLNQGKTQIDAVIGFHRAYNDITPSNAVGALTDVYYRYTRSLADFADIEGNQILAACQDNVATDKYPADPELPDQPLPDAG